jgi:hypothetical protein
MNEDLEQNQTLDNEHKEIEAAPEPRAKSLEETVREAYEMNRCTWVFRWVFQGGNKGEGDYE